MRRLTKFCTWFPEYVIRPMVDCSKKIQKYSTRLEAITACSRDADCGAVSQSCASKQGEKQFFYTCEKFFRGHFPDHILSYPKIEDCKTVVLYQKSEYFY